MKSCIRTDKIFWQWKHRGMTITSVQCDFIMDLHRFLYVWYVCQVDMYIVQFQIKLKMCHRSSRAYQVFFFLRHKNISNLSNKARQWVHLISYDGLTKESTAKPNVGWLQHSGRWDVTKLLLISRTCWCCLIHYYFRQAPSGHVSVYTG